MRFSNRLFNGPFLPVDAAPAGLGIVSVVDRKDRRMFPLGAGGSKWCSRFHGTLAGSDLICAASRQGRISGNYLKLLFRGQQRRRNGSSVFHMYWQRLHVHLQPSRRTDSGLRPNQCSMPASAIPVPM